MQLLAKNGLLALDTPAVMGVLNVTPDSFFDGGAYATVDRARARAERLVAEGAAIIDVGARSYRKDAAHVDAEEELRRIVPVLQALERDRLPAAISVDTTRWRIAQLALELGVSIINDCSGGKDPFMLALAARTGAALIIMHNPVPVIDGRPIDYADVVESVASELEQGALRARSAGIDGASIVLDPGLEFGKRPVDDIRLLSHLDRIAALGYTTLLAASRKRFLTQITGSPAAELLPASLAAVAVGVDRGIRIVRTHDVAQTVQFLKVFRPNGEHRDAAMGTTSSWISTSNSPKQAFSSRTRTTPSRATLRAASNASRGRI